MEVLYTEVLLRAGFVFRLLDLSNKEQHGPSPLPPPEEWFCLSQRLASKAISSTSVLQTLGIPYLPEVYSFSAVYAMIAQSSLRTGF